MPSVFMLMLSEDHQIFFFGSIHLKKCYELGVLKDNFLIPLSWNNSDYLENLDKTFLKNLEYLAKRKKINTKFVKDKLTH